MPKADICPPKLEEQKVVIYHLRASSRSCSGVLISSFRLAGLGLTFAPAIGTVILPSLVYLIALSIKFIFKKVVEEPFIFTGDKFFDGNFDQGTR